MEGKWVFEVNKHECVGFVCVSLAIVQLFIEVMNKIAIVDVCVTIVQKLVPSVIQIDQNSLHFMLLKITTNRLHLTENIFMAANGVLKHLKYLDLWSYRILLPFRNTDRRGF